VLAVGVLAVPWLVLMQREFGNPVFPLFNGWFRSPHFLEYNMINERFALRDSLALLAFPFQMAALGPRIYAENFARTCALPRWSWRCWVSQCWR
jgi:hypothetical protein